MQSHTITRNWSNPIRFPFELNVFYIWFLPYSDIDSLRLRLVSWTYIFSNVLYDIIRAFVLRHRLDWNLKYSSFELNDDVWTGFILIDLKFNFGSWISEMFMNYTIDYFIKAIMFENLLPNRSIWSI